MATDKTFSNIISLFKTYVEKQKDLNAAENEKRFFRTYKEAVANCSDIGNIFFCHTGISVAGQGNHENISGGWRISFRVAELIEVDDFDGEETAKSKCFSIAGDIVSALIRDRRDLQKVYYFNAETVNMREFENAGDGYCGCDCSLVLAQPMTFNYKPANWNL